MRSTNIVSKIFVGVVFVLGFHVYGCAQEVRYNYLPGTNFGAYKTYKWVRVANQQYPPQILDTQIKQAIDEELALKGLRLATDSSAELLVTYQLAITQETEWYSYGGAGWRWGMGTVSTMSTTINIGTLVVDFYDAAAQQQIWSGTATKQLNPKKDPAKNQKNLKKAMAKLLKNFPPVSQK